MAKITQWKAALYDWRQRRIMEAAAGPLEKLSLTRDTELRPEQTARLTAVQLSAVAEFDGMLARVGLDTSAAPLRNAERLDLYLNCVDCRRREACRRWLALGGDDDGYRRFCPNAWMFDRLLQLGCWRGLDAP